VFDVPKEEQCDKTNADRSGAVVGGDLELCLAQAGRQRPRLRQKREQGEAAKAAPVDPSTITAAPGGGGGKVWVNTSTSTPQRRRRVVWQDQARQYMTEADAAKAGCHAAKDSSMGKKMDDKK